MTYHGDWDDDHTPYPRRKPKRRGCGGWGAYEGPCGAPDCPACHPEYFGRCPECDERVYIEDGIPCENCGYVEEEE